MSMWSCIAIDCGERCKPLKPSKRKETNVPHVARIKDWNRMVKK